MKRFFTRISTIFLAVFMVFISVNAQVSVGCWASWAGSGSGGSPGLTPICSNQTLNVPSTGYTYWAPGAAGSRGGQYTFSAAGGSWGAGYYISIYYLNAAASAWVPVTGGLNSVTFTMPLACEGIANTQAAPYLVTVTNSANSSANWARDCSANNGTNWTGNSATLTYRSNSASIGTLTNGTQRQFCDVGGNYTAAGIPTSSGNVGKIIWEWGSNNGNWNTWICNNASPGASAFPKKVSNSDANADRTRYTVSGGGCPDATATILITNYQNEAPTTLATSANNYCSAATPATTTLTATFPTNINMNGVVRFYSGSCGGALLGSVNPTALSTTAALTITAPSTTTTYFARYEPGAFAGCSNTACASVTLTVNPTPVVSGATSICDNTTPTYSSSVGGSTWGTSLGSITSGGVLTTNVPTPTANQTAVITATAAGCSSAGYNVTVHNSPTITAPTAVCENATATVSQDVTGTTQSASLGTWSGSTFTPALIAGTTQNQTITLTATNGACVTNTPTIRVDNNTTATAGANQAQCNNGNFTLAGNNPTLTVTGSTGAWTCTANCAGITYVAPTAFNSSMGSVSPNTTTTSRWTVTNGTCSNFSDVNTRNDGIATVTGPTNPCDADGTANYSQTGGSGVVWTFAPTPAAGTINSSTGVVTLANIATPTQSASATVTATSGSCVTDYPITISNKTTFTNSFGSLCTGQTVTLTADVTGTTFSGTGVSGGVFTAPTVSGSQSFILTATNGPTSCQDQRIITVYEPSTITSSGADMCQGGTRTLTATPGPGGFSSVACPTCIVGVGFTAPVPTGSSQVIDIVYQVFGAPCSTTQNITVYRNPSTATIASTPLNACGLVSPALGGNTPTYGTGAWSQVSGPGTSSFSASGSGSSTATVTAYGTYVFRWTISNGPCTASPADVTVNYYQAPTTATVGATQNRCGTLTSTSLGGNTPTVGTGAWSQVSGPGTSSYSASTSGTSTATASTYGTYVYRWTISNGTCPASTADITVNYYDNPTTATVGITQARCGTLISASLGGNTPTVGTGVWSQVSGPGTSSFSASGSGSSTATATLYGTYVYRWTISNGTCTPSTADITVTYFNIPTIASVGPTQNLCGTLTSNPLGGNTPIIGTGSWSQVSGPGTSTFSASSSGSSTATVTAYGSYVFRWTITVGGPCPTSTADITVNYGAPVAVPTSGGDQEACYRTAVPNLSATVGAGETVDWYDAASGGSLVKSNSLTFNEATDGSGPNPVPGTYTYYAEGRNTSTSCLSTSRVAITLIIRSVPIISPTATPGTACAGDAVALAANATAPALGGYSITSYAWSSGLVGSVASGTVNPTMTTTYTVTVTNNYTCTNSADATVTIKTGSAYVVLPPSTVTTAVEQCTDGGWTYYANSSTPDDWIFAINKNGNTFTASVDVTVLGSRATIDNINTATTGYEHGSYLMKRYWNVNLQSGSIGSTVGVRFFYDASEIADALAARDAAWASYPATTKTPFRWFKTVGVPFDATAIASIDGNSFNGFSNISLSGTTGTINGVDYTEFSGITSFSGGTGGYGFSSPGTGLPVKLISFTATGIENRYVRLDWATATEVDNMGFEIERSIDGTNFTKIGWVKGNDNSTQRIDYSFEDREAELDVRYYYRLKQIDNGNVAFEYSSIASAMLVSDAKSTVGEFVPNPSKNVSTIDLLVLRNQEAIISVVDVTGKVIRKETLTLTKGFNRVALDVNDLANSTYMVSFLLDDQRVTKRLSVVR